MPSINAMRSLALAGRAKEDILEKVPGFYNSVSQALGQAVVGAQDNTQSVMDQRTGAANQLLAKIKQTVDGRGGIVEVGINNAIDTVTAAVDIFNTALNWTYAAMNATDIAFTVLKIAKVTAQLAGYKATMDAAMYDYLQWATQAGYTNGGQIEGLANFQSIGARGMATHRDALMPRYTHRRMGPAGAYSTMYDWAAVGSLATVGRYNT